ncbi:helix-turn-helix domain-containing protein [Streptomyces sp. NPDC002643]
MTNTTQLDDLDPSASPLHFYGYELRRCREGACLTQKQLGQVLGYTSSLVGQIETAKKVPTLGFSERSDAALGTDGMFTRLHPLVIRSQLPAWFREVAEIEERAYEICAYQNSVVHGLLQSEDYADAVMGGFDPNGKENRLAVRLARQRILEKEQAPVLWVILGEAVLYQKMGGADVMRGQLQKLLAFETNPRINIQILPFDVGAHAGLAGSYTLFRCANDPDIIYREGIGTGYSSADPDLFQNAALRYDHLRAAALSLKDSAELIRRVMEERYEEQRDRGMDPVA